MSRHLLYFAYGSNMATRRLQARVPTARFVATGRLHGYELRFAKRGRDGSGKCTVLEGSDPERGVHGVLFAFPHGDRSPLDAAEGLGAGYDLATRIVDAPGGPREAYLYLAQPDSVDDRLLPFDWYKAFVVAGAREHGLPSSYIDGLEAVPARPDPDRVRAARNRRILEGVVRPVGAESP